jgi:hypothetical protein
MKKEELISEVVRLKRNNEVLEKRDEESRKAFALAFSWYKKRNQYDYEAEIRIPLWTEIYVEVGKLLAARTFYDLEGNVSECQVAIEQMKLDLEKWFKDKKPE